MKNSFAIPVYRVGEMELKFISENVVTLTNIFFVLEVRKNLVFTRLFDKFSFRLVIEANKLILSKDGMLVGKGYHYNDVFKLNIFVMSNNDEFFVYLVESSFSL